MAFDSMMIATVIFLLGALSCGILILRRRSRRKRVKMISVEEVDRLLSNLFHLGTEGFFVRLETIRTRNFIQFAKEGKPGAGSIRLDFPLTEWSGAFEPELLRLSFRLELRISLVYIGEAGTKPERMIVVELGDDVEKATELAKSLLDELMLEEKSDLVILEYGALCSPEESSRWWEGERDDTALLVPYDIQELDGKQPVNSECLETSESEPSVIFVFEWDHDQFDSLSSLIEFFSQFDTYLPSLAGKVGQEDEGFFFANPRWQTDTKQLFGGLQPLPCSPGEWIDSFVPDELKVDALRGYDATFQLGSGYPAICSVGPEGYLLAFRLQWEEKRGQEYSRLRPE